jgi:hypothetical protein
MNEENTKEKERREKEIRAHLPKWMQTLLEIEDEVKNKNNSSYSNRK